MGPGCTSRLKCCPLATLGTARGLEVGLAVSRRLNVPGLGREGHLCILSARRLPVSPRCLCLSVLHETAGGQADTEGGTSKAAHGGPQSRPAEPSCGWPPREPLLALESPGSCDLQCCPGGVADFHTPMFFSFPQLPNFQRALFQQAVGACKPCSDPNLSVAEKGIVPLPAGRPCICPHAEGLTLVPEHQPAEVEPHSSTQAGLWAQP